MRRVGKYSHDDSLQPDWRSLNLATSETLRWSELRAGDELVFINASRRKEKKRSRTVFPIKFAAGSTSRVDSRFKRMGMIKHSWTAGSDI